MSLFFHRPASNITPAGFLLRWLSGEVMGYHFVMYFITRFIALECKTLSSIHFHKTRTNVFFFNPHSVLNYNKLFSYYISRFLFKVCQKHFDLSTFRIWCAEPKRNYSSSIRLQGMNERVYGNMTN